MRIISKIFNFLVWSITIFVIGWLLGISQGVNGFENFIKEIIRIFSGS